MDNFFSWLKKTDKEKIFMVDAGQTQMKKTLKMNKA